MTIHVSHDPKSSSLKGSLAHELVALVLEALVFSPFAFTPICDMYYMGECLNPIEVHFCVLGEWKSEACSVRGFMISPSSVWAITLAFALVCLILAYRSNRARICKLCY